MRKITNPELNRPTLEQYSDQIKTPVIVVADNIRSLNNVGSLFRTCDAFAMEALYLCGITATPPNKEIHKTALGAENAVEWKFYRETAEAMRWLKEQGYILLAIEQVEGAVFLEKFTADKNRKYALVFGNEVKGVAQDIVDMCDGAIEIPQCGTKHSLNVSVSAGIVLWEFYKQWKG